MSGKGFSEAKGAAVASAGTTDIWTPADGNYLHVTGTTTITSFGTAPQAGAERVVIFDGILTLTHNATSLILPSAANITTAAGDRAIVRADTTANMIVISYERASGIPLVSVGGMTFLGTMTTTSGSSISLNSLVLTPYKTLYASVKSVSLSGAGYININSGQVTYSTSVAADTLKGYIAVDLGSGAAVGFVYFGTAAVNINAYLMPASALTTASTTITITASAGTFDAGSIDWYGVT